MQYIVTKQIAVEADSPEDAVAKAHTDGKTISLAANVRPQPSQQPAQPRPGVSVAPTSNPPKSV